MVIEALSILKEKVWDPYMGLEEKMEALRGKMKVLIGRRDDIMVETKDAELHSDKRRKTEFEHWQCSVQTLEHCFKCLEQEVEQSFNLSRIGLSMSNRADKIHKEVEDLIEQGKFSEGIFLNVYEENVQPLITTNVKGQAFMQSLRKVLMYVNEVSSIGIYGMGGVGKTTLAMHIHNHLLRESRFSGHVYWITVSQDFSVTKLQNDIARTLNLDISTKDDDKKRAAKLFLSLKKKNDFVLMLDDVWTHFDVNKVGIPLENGGGKLIITSRSVEACDRIGCSRKVKVDTLSMTESWQLFLETLDYTGDLPQEIEELAKKMTKKCDGLPLGLKTMAASMRGVTDVFEWRDAFEEFEESYMQTENMNDEVFPILRCSYNRLRDPKLQKCFLRCCLYPEDYKIERDELIRFFIVEELLVRRNSRKAELDQGHAVLNKLERASLLESVVNFKGERCVRMHDLIRDMALHIARNECNWMGKAGAQLHEIPEERAWSEDLDKVSLMNNDIREISVPLSYVCSKLTTLLLQGNISLNQVADSFFTQMPGLRVLDLSETAIENLPSSLSNLGRLSALRLQRCNQLTYLPPLNNLKNLIELDLYKTNIEEAPEGLERLVHLRFLDMQLHKKPAADILARLTNLQSLSISFVARVEDLQAMRQLEVFRGVFVDVCSFNRFVKHQQSCRKPGFFDIALGPGQSSCRDVDCTPNGNRVTLNNLVLTRENAEMLCYEVIENRQDVAVLPLDIHELVISNSEFKTLGNSLLDAIPSLIQSNDLREIEIGECEGIQFLMRLSNCSETMTGDHGLTSTRIPFQSLEKLYLDCVEDFIGLVKLELGEALPPLSTFSHLRCLEVSQCDKMKRLIPRWLLRYLQHLAEITVYCCKEMEEIIAEEEEPKVNHWVRSALSSSSSSMIPSNGDVFLPKLQSLHLYRLPKLQSIYKGRITCDSIQRIEVVGCPKLKRLPFTLPIQNGRPSAPPALQSIEMHKEEWKSLEWDHSQYKYVDVLLPFLKTPWKY